MHTCEQDTCNSQMSDDVMQLYEEMALFWLPFIPVRISICGWWIW